MAELEPGFDKRISPRFLYLAKGNIVLFEARFPNENRAGIPYVTFVMYVIEDLPSKFLSEYFVNTYEI